MDESPPRRRRRVRNDNRNDCPSKTQISSINESQDSIDYLSKLSDNWFSKVDNCLIPELNSKFDKLYEIKKQNLKLGEELEECLSTELNGITEEIGIKSCNIDECLLKAETMRNELKSGNQSLKETLKKQKTDKTKAEKKLKISSKNLEKINKEKEENQYFKDDKECKLLAEIMKCKYHITSNKRLVSLNFEDRKRNQRLISMDRKDVANEFWTFLDTKHNI